MTESDVRDLLLVQAYEQTHDAAWSTDDAHWATTEARRAEGSTASAERLLAARAKLAATRIASREPLVMAARDGKPVPAWCIAVAVLLALALGVALDAFGGWSRINILAMPLLGLIAWNAVVYVAVIVGWGRDGMRQGGPSRAAPVADGGLHATLSRVGQWVMARVHTSGDLPVLASSGRAWAAASRTMQHAKVSTWLHAGAAVVALGLIAGMYWRGISTEYRAGWESTFVTAEAVHRIVSLLFGPATAWLGEPLPGVAAIAALQFGVGPGESAAPWIHRIALTVLIFVVLPRLALAGLAYRRTRRLKAALPVDLDTPYFDQLRRDLAGSSYSDPTASTRRDAPTRDTPVIALSLIAHTNVGKTTLARTLLQRDIGEVRDEEHVTLEATRHLMIEALPPHGRGERLELWDTPGFGDSQRLARRLAQADQPIGWFLREVWDRWRDRDLWLTQRAVRNVAEHADVVLYVVDASQPAKELDYLDAEMAVLDLLGKPVIVLLNQTGWPWSSDDEAAQTRGWRQRLARAACVRDVLALDAFSRCWVQEDRLLWHVAAALPASRRAAFNAVQAAWLDRSEQRLQAAVEAMALALQLAVQDREMLGGGGWSAKLRDVGAALGVGREAAAKATALAMQALAERSDASLAQATQRVIEAHGLDGRAGRDVHARLAEHFAQATPVSVSKSAGWGGAAAGAAFGLKADLLTGGLSLGGGMLVGAVLGALGGAAVATSVNKVRGVDEASVEWSDAALDRLALTLVMTYLGIAHHGRGQGAWRAAEQPAHWQTVVQAQMAGDDSAWRAALKALRAQRGQAGEPSEADAITAWLGGLVRRTLHALYPPVPPERITPGRQPVDHSMLKR